MTIDAPAPAPAGPDERTADAERVRALTDLDALAVPPRRDLVALVDLAALLSGMPMATINLVSDTQQHQVATYGFAASVCRREDSMCARTLHETEPVVVDDASVDERFRDNPFVTGELGRVRFYASQRLTTREGVVIGTLCVFDEKPRTLSPDQVQALCTVADRVVDVLELELAGRRLAAANEQLAASNERLADFAGQVSHDLKNPLTAVAMSLEMAREEADDVPDLAGTPLVSLLERAARGADRMQGMIDDMLAYARGGAEPRLEPVDLAAVMAAVVDDLAGDVADGRLDVQDLPVVVGDPVQLRLVLQNLVANGLKFTREGEQPRVSVSARRTTSGWRVEVADHGRGVAAEERERVFEPFVRLDKRVPGTGVGLATCRRILAAHGGRTGLDEAPGGGTLAWFELPDLPEDDPA